MLLGTVSSRWGKRLEPARRVLGPKNEILLKVVVFTNRMRNRIPHVHRVQCMQLEVQTNKLPPSKNQYGVRTTPTRPPGLRQRRDLERDKRRPCEQQHDRNAEGSHL